MHNYGEVNQDSKNVGLHKQPLIEKLDAAKWALHVHKYGLPRTVVDGSVILVVLSPEDIWDHANSKTAFTTDL